jgi:hypothetical protein
MRNSVCISDISNPKHNENIADNDEDIVSNVNNHFLTCSASANLVLEINSVC